MTWQNFFNKYKQEPSCNSFSPLMKICKNEEERYQAFKARMEAEKNQEEYGNQFWQHHKGT